MLAAAGILGMAACGADGTPGPTTPSPTPPAGDPLRAFTVSCDAALIIGQRAPCVAVAGYASGGEALVSLESTWSSSRPEVIAVDNLGGMTGRSAGQATVTASYQGRLATSPVVVTEEDALRISSGQGHQGAFTPGSTVTLWLQGYYSVASAPSGRLRLQISDQTGTIATTAPLVVQRGGDFFLLSSTFVVPDTSVEVCRTAVLDVGATTIAAPQSKTFAQWCIPIRR